MNEAQTEQLMIAIGRLEGMDFTLKQKRALGIYHPFRCAVYKNGRQWALGTGDSIPEAMIDAVKLTDYWDEIHREVAENKTTKTKP